MSDNSATRERVYQVSANRERASHKLRYVEGSAPTSGDCRLCVGSLANDSGEPVEVIVEPAQANDVVELAFMEKQLYGNDAYPALFFHQARQQWPNGLQVIKVGNANAGYSLVTPVANKRASLMSLLIGKKHQGKGLGQQLLAATIDIATAEGWQTLELSVAPDNQAAIKLYQNNGFEALETIPDYLGPGQDRLLMQRQL